MKKFIFFLAAAMALTVQAAFAQQRPEVSGTITDSSTGEPIPFASIVIDGTMDGVESDIDGTYSIKVPSLDDAVLAITFIGYRSQLVKINGRAVVDVALVPDALALQETIVVAFGTSTKESFTGSATVVSSETLAKRITTNVSNALVGTTPGLQIRGGSGSPGAAQGSINIRGIASMYADTDPLIIVDGAPWTISLSNIPQEDVESITVLKDAASAALYGSRGAAGVILITTKSGQNRRTQVNVDMKWGANTRSVQDYRTIDDPGRYYEEVYGQYYSYYTNSYGYDSAAANAAANSVMLNHLAYNVYTLPDGENLIGMDGRLNPNATLGRAYDANGETYWLQPDSWRDAAYRRGFRQEYNISVNGATDRSSFYGSFGYLDEDGYLVNSGYKRYTARLKADFQAFKWMKIGANIGYVNSTVMTNPNISDSATTATNLEYFISHIGPIYPIYVRVLDSNGNPTIRTDQYGNPQYDYGVSTSSYPGLTRPFMSTGNPLGSNNYNEVYSQNSVFNGSFTIDINFTPWLKFNSTNSVDWGHTNYSDYETGLYGPKVSVNGQIGKSQTDGLRQNYDQTLTFYKQFGKHNVNVMIGHEWFYNKTVYLYSYAQGLFTSDVKEINAAANTVNSNSYTTEYEIEGYFASAQYDYDGRLFLSGSYRRDGSSRFAKGHRWGNFWSVGTAWLINKERWFNAPNVNMLKLKASIGQQGNDNVGNWAYTNLYELTASSTTDMSATLYYLGNEDITWETTTTFNLGAEFGFWNNRLSGEVDYYYKKTTDLLFWLSIPRSGGASGYYDNIGDISNTGVELSLQGALIRSRNVDWTVNLNISHNTDRILSLPASKTNELGGFTSSNLWYKEGGHMYTYFLSDYAGVNENGEPLYWVDAELGEGVINRPAKNHSYTTTNPNNASKYEQGDSTPKIYGGFGTTLELYGIDLTVTFDYQVGGHIYDWLYQKLMANVSSAATAGQAIHEDAFNAWSADNTSSTIPRMQYGDSYTNSTCNRWLTDASYLNFQSFTVGYSLPKKWVKTLGLRKIRLYATGENLWLWSARQGLDPRYSYQVTSVNSSYAPTRTIMGGIQLTF
ncbi:MAG: SusC/RagA family TonB-linked outer membrane protein [Bacteroidales bacterium]|nr:SusC/RagA family TonB-linked outer membrane protein [Bacteroidales bacterium]